MGVDVDEARGHEAVAGVDLELALAGHGTERGYAVAVDREVGGDGRSTAAIHQCAVSNDDVVVHACSCFGGD